MKCPKCNTINKADAFHCENCSNRLRIKTNKLALIFAILFIVAGIFAIYFYSEFPQSYKTRNSNQQLYIFCGGVPNGVNCQVIESGTTVTIIKKENGWGLTNFGGWLPMDSLEKK